MSALRIARDDGDRTILLDRALAQYTSRGWQIRVTRQTGDALRALSSELVVGGHCEHEARAANRGHER